MSVLVGRQAPDFTVAAVLGNGEIEENYTLSKQIKGKYGLVFFYPFDFTFVCPTELIALDKRFDDFKARGVEIIAVSNDSVHTHSAWRKTAINDGGIGKVRYSLAADVKHEISIAYDVMHPEVGAPMRGAFIIDKNFNVRSQIVNDLPIGRNIEEIIRLIDAIEFHEQNGEVCPANWNKGKAALSANAEGVAKYLTENAETL